MTQETVTIVIKDGKWTVEASGFSGASCEAATRDLIRKLGGATSVKKKAAEVTPPPTAKKTLKR